MIGGLDIGFVDGFAAPVGHFNLGASFRDVRIQGELDTGIWSTDEASEESSMYGSYDRVGWALRYYWMNLDVRQPGRQAPQLLRMYVEAGMGREWIEAKHFMDGPRIDIARNDIAFGFGMAQEANVGPMVLGGHFGLRVQVAEAPEPRNFYVACRGSCEVPSYRPYDVAVFFVLGLVVGK